MPAQAGAGTRSLKLYFLHTGEKAVIAFKKDGKYLPEGLSRLNQFLRDWRRDEPTRMDPHLFDLIWEVYKQSGSHDYIHVVSGYRSPSTNAMLRRRGHGVARYSQHMLGKAMDFFLPDVPLAKLRELGLKAGAGGVGYYPTSGSPFVHLDVGSVRHWPRMTREQLVRIFPHGKTMHIPADGKPLPGYEQALAAYKARQAAGVVTALASAQPGTGSKERKGNFFTRLFASAQEEQAQDEEANSVPAPNPVATVSTGNDQAHPTALAGVPVPNWAPRSPAASSGKPLDVASVDAPPADITPPIEAPATNTPVADTQAGQEIDLANIPIPEPRPDYVPSTIFADARRKQEPDDATLVAALTADEIESLRRTAIPSPRPDNRPQRGSRTSAAKPVTGSVDPDEARRAILTAMRGSAAAGDELTLPDRKASLTVASIPPSPDPRPRAGRRTLELALAATQERPGTASEAIRSLIEADNRLRRAADVVTSSNLPASRDRAGPQPKTQTTTPTTMVRFGPISGKAGSASRVAKQEMHPDSWNAAGATVLASFMPIERVGRIRAPAYGMSVVRKSPKEILVAGFVKVSFYQPMGRFTGSSRLTPIFASYAAN